jgi:hypothetical protein
MSEVVEAKVTDGNGRPVMVVKRNDDKPADETFRRQLISLLQLYARMHPKEFQLVAAQMPRER